jgi:hypothetical protein
MARGREAPEVGGGEAAVLLGPAFMEKTHVVSPPGLGTRGDGLGGASKQGFRDVSRAAWLFWLVAVAIFSFAATLGTVTALHGSWNTTGRPGDLPLLGALQCDNAFSVPPEASSDRFSWPFVSLANFADQIYLLCVECENVVAPEAWRGKVLLVNGRVIDECVKDTDLDHWHRASFSHAVAVTHANEHGHDVVAVIEDDARSDFTVKFSDHEYENLQRLIRPDKPRLGAPGLNGVIGSPGLNGVTGSLDDVNGMNADLVQGIASPEDLEQVRGVPYEKKAMNASPMEEKKWTWSFVRFGYRPFAIESEEIDAAFGIDAANVGGEEKKVDGTEKKPTTCPSQCRCERTSQNTCLVRNAGCDLRSSEAYLVNRNAFADFTHRLQGGVVDYDVLQSFQNMMVVTPMVSYQEKLDISMDNQRDLQERFGKLCARGEVPAVPTMRARSGAGGAPVKVEKPQRPVDFSWDANAGGLSSPRTIHR